MSELDLLSDLQKVKRCADRAGIDVSPQYELRPWAAVHGPLVRYCMGATYEVYDPLTNKAQAFELVERLHLDVDYEPEGWAAVDRDTQSSWASSPDLARAIVECVSRMPS